MITTSTEYYENLYKIQDANKPDVSFRIPQNETVYNIDLSTRSISVPTYLSVAHDHVSEIVYFKCNRYFDNVDLATLPCVIQWVNANNKSGLYIVPYYDIQTEEDKIIMPWAISGNVTEAAGTVEFSFRFFQVDTNKKLKYSLGTLTAKSKILYGMDLSEEVQEQEGITSTYLDQVAYLLKVYAEQTDIYWVDLEGTEIDSIITFVAPDPNYTLTELKAWMAEYNIPESTNLKIVYNEEGPKCYVTDGNGPVFSINSIRESIVKTFMCYYYVPYPTISLIANQDISNCDIGDTISFTGSATDMFGDVNVTWSVSDSNIIISVENNIATLTIPKNTEDFEVILTSSAGNSEKLKVKIKKEYTEDGKEVVNLKNYDSLQDAIDNQVFGTVIEIPEGTDLSGITSIGATANIDFNGATLDQDLTISENAIIKNVIFTGKVTIE